MDLSIQEIIQPLDQLGPDSPTAHVFTHSPPEYPTQVMAAATNQPAWRAITPLNLDAPLHDFPKHPEQVLPKFDPGKRNFYRIPLEFFFISLWMF